jgi:Holliday junction DNA helicase RuvB
MMCERSGWRVSSNVGQRIARVPGYTGQGLVISRSDLLVSMPREPLIQSQAPEDDVDRDLRPQRMRDMVGQREVRERLQISVEAAQKRGESLGHVLFDGPPGLGKTTFARCLPNELGVSLQMAVGAGLKAPKDLLPYLTNLEERSVLFIDEIHRIPRSVEEYLYTAMEDFRIDIVLGEGINARTLNMPLKPFTLIGATTRTGMLSAPLRDRFQIREHLGFYELAEIMEIVQRNAVKLSIPLDVPAAAEIARRSRSTPRVANVLLRWVRDYAQSRAAGHGTLDVVRAALQMLGVDELGLGKLDRNYLETVIRVFSGGPVGIEALAHTMNVAVDTLEDDVEPFLLRSELIIRSPRGRMLAAKAYRHLKQDVPATGQKPLFE